MKLKLCIGGVTALCLVGASLSGCSKAQSAGTEASAAAPADDWTLVDNPAAPAVIQANRTVALEGGGKLELLLSCDYRPNANAVMNGFWLKMDMALVGRQDPSSDASLTLDSLATDGQTAHVAVVESSGEPGSMLLTLTDQTHFVYENNQTNELNQDNNDPAKVEMAQKFDLQLSDGRTVSIDTRAVGAGYKAVMTKCAAQRPKPAT